MDRLPRCSIHIGSKFSETSQATKQTKHIRPLTHGQNSNKRKCNEQVDVGRREPGQLKARGVYRRVRRVARLTTATDSSVVMLEGAATRLLRQVAGVRAAGRSSGSATVTGAVTPQTLEMMSCKRVTWNKLGSKNKPSKVMDRKTRGGTYQVLLQSNCGQFEVL